MKKQEDKGRSDRVFQVGDTVLVKLQSYVQSSLAPRSNQKLAFKFFGPFQVLAKIGAVAYKLQLPEGSSVHPVFHVSQLKPVIGRSDQQVTSDIPNALESVQVPEAVLHSCTITRGILTVHQALIKWSGLPDTLATWEDLEALKQCFPQAPAWGEAGFKGRGNVSTASPVGAKHTASAGTAQEPDGDGPAKLCVDALHRCSGSVVAVGGTSNQASVLD